MLVVALEHVQARVGCHQLSTACLVAVPHPQAVLGPWGVPSAMEGPSLPGLPPPCLGLSVAVVVGVVVVEGVASHLLVRLAGLEPSPKHASDLKHICRVLCSVGMGIEMYIVWLSQLPRCMCRIPCHGFPLSHSTKLWGTNSTKHSLWVSQGRTHGAGYQHKIDYQHQFCNLLCHRHHCQWVAAPAPAGLQHQHQRSDRLRRRNGPVAQGAHKHPADLHAHMEGGQWS